jgi:hypothetical protein
VVLRRAAAQVPRLNGARRGVLATRSPHRPTPLGLSVARVRAVRGRVLELAGLDCVDGSPVLDIKPFLPFCDAPHGATAPDWAQARAFVACIMSLCSSRLTRIMRAAQAEVPGGAEPLAVADVACDAPASAALAAAWAAARREGGPRCGMAPLYDSALEFEALVREVLGRDIRSAHQRERTERDPAEPYHAASAAAASGEPHAPDAPPPPQPQRAPRGRWRVALDGVDVGYELDAAGHVTITDAQVAHARAGEGGEDDAGAAGVAA